MFNEEYNTQRPDVILKEYGRNVQKMVEHLFTIEDKDKRTQQAKIIIELMKQLSPTQNNNIDQYPKLWDDLHIMSNFSLDLESAYPMPEKELLGKKPAHIGYATNKVRAKHYGRNVDLLIEQACNIEDETEKDAATIYIAKLMKTFYTIWNRELTDEQIILNDLKKLSNGRLTLDLERVKSENILANQRERRNNNNSGSSHTSRDRNGSQNNNRRQNNGGSNNQYQQKRRRK